MPPLYKWFYVAEVFTIIALVAHLVQASAILSSQNQDLWTTQLPFTLTFYHIPLAIANTIGLIITWKYWGWLITERKK